MSEFDIVINLDNDDLAKAVSSTGEFRASVKDLILDNVSEQIDEKLEDVLESRDFERAVESMIDNYDLSDTVKDEVSNAISDLELLTEDNFETKIAESDYLARHFASQDDLVNKALKELFVGLANQVANIVTLIQKENM